MLFLATQIINDNVNHLVNILLQVILWSLIISSPGIIMILSMYAYKRYKKWETKEEREKERIKVGQAKQISKNDEEIRWQHEEMLRLSQNIDAMKRTEKDLRDKLGIHEDVEADDSNKEINLSAMNIKQLKELAKQRGIKGYSKMKKAKLINILQG